MNDVINSDYINDLNKIKETIKQNQNKAMIVVNSAMIMTYYEIGTIINKRKSGGNKYIQKLSEDLKEYGSGYSTQNLYRMSQIANEFRDYNENLIFESMDQVDYKLGDEYDYETLINLTQSFIDIIRNSGGKNKDRLLLIPGANADYGLTVSEKFQIPYDPSNNFAVSIHYY